jgi:hypothetical protein
MTSRKVATARRCRVGPACAYPAIRGGWPTALVSKAGSRSKRDKAIEQCRTDLTTRSLLIPPRLEAPPAAGLFIYRKVGTLIAYSSTRNRSISIPLVGHLARFPRREALAHDAGRPHGYVSDPCNCYLEITETVTLISDTPRILTFVPDTRRMKSSSP